MTGPAQACSFNAPCGADPSSGDILDASVDARRPSPAREKEIPAGFKRALHVAFRSDHARRAQGLARPPPGGRTERRHARRAHHSGEPIDLCRAEQAGPHAAELFRDDRSRNEPRHAEAMAGAAGQFGALARDRRSGGSERRHRSLGRLCPPAGDTRPRQASGHRSYRSSYRPGRQSLVVSYKAGYAAQGETQTVPSSSPLQLAAFAPYGPWAFDFGVVYAATGVALSPVAARLAPGNTRSAAGFYTFSAADAGHAVSLSYGYVPQDVAQAALELAAERFRASERIGLRSKSVGGQETISYDVSAVPAPVLAMLSPIGGWRSDVHARTRRPRCDERAARRLPGALAAALAAKASDLAAALSNLVKTDKLAGEFSMPARARFRPRSLPTLRRTATAFALRSARAATSNMRRSRNLAARPEHMRSCRRNLGAGLPGRRRAALRAQGRASRLADSRAFLFAFFA